MSHSRQQIESKFGTRARVIAPTARSLRAAADLEKRFVRLAEEEGVSASLQALGGQFQVYFADEKVRDYRTAAKADPERFRVFQAEMLREGIYTLPIMLFHHGLVAAHSKGDLERILAAMRVGLQRVKKEFGS